MRKSSYPVKLFNGKIIRFDSMEKRSLFLAYYSKLRGQPLEIIQKVEQYLNNMPKFIDTSLNQPFLDLYNNK